MTADPSLLPKEVAALVHHIELNRAGWWDKVIQRLALAAVWWAAQPPSVDELKQTLSQEFKLSLSNDKLCAVLRALEMQDLLVVLPSEKYRIPDSQRQAFEKEIALAEQVESKACEFFCTLAKELCVGIDAINGWNSFQKELLMPLIKEAGANAYRLLTGDGLRADENLVDHFLKGFDSAFHSGLRELVTIFLDPKQAEVRAHVSRMLHARFCVEAGGLSEEAIQTLNASIGKQIQFRMFVDTNFLFSLLELHENPSNTAARELLDLISQLKSNPKVKLFIVSRTIDEAKSSIASAMQSLSGIPTGGNFTQAALNARFSGMTEKFLSERLRRGGKLIVEDWFEPYLSDFVAVARGKGVEFFNENIDSYFQRQDVVDDILYVLDFEKRFDEGKRKSYQKVAHDMILWHFVKDQRPAYVESPIEARDWILTVDFRLIGFDQYKQRKTGSKMPLCIHPTSLIQLLQFWLPRSKEFEEAMLGSLRLPFLFQEFDVESERTSLRILKGLGRFEGRDDISVETITSIVLNDGLRARLQSESENGETETSLIRDALLEEMRARAEAEADKAKQLEAAVKEKEVALSELDARERSKDDEVKRLSERVAEEELRAKAADERLTAQELEVTQLKTSLEQFEEGKRSRAALLRYFGLLTPVIVMTGIAGWQADRFFSDWAKVIGSIPIKVLSATLVFVAGHLVLEALARNNESMTTLWPFKQIRRFRKWLWGIVILVFALGVFGNLYANWIQKQIDQKPSATSSPHSGDSSAPAPGAEGISKRQ